MVTYTFTNGTVADATEVNQNFQDVKPRFYYNLVTKAITTDDTDSISVTIPQNDLGSNGTLYINGTFLINQIGGVDVKLYIDGVLKRTISRGANDDQGGTVHDEELSFIHIEESVDTSQGDIEVAIKGSAGVASNFRTDGLIVTGYKL